MLAGSMAAEDAGRREAVAPEALAAPLAAAVPDDAVGAWLGRLRGATLSPRRKTAHAAAPPPTMRSTTTMMAVRAGRDLMLRSFRPVVRGF
jgi:hypothetical protein